MRNSIHFSRLSLVSMFGLSLLLVSTCSRETAKDGVGSPVPASTQAQTKPEEVDPSLLGRLRNESWKGDIDGLVKRRYIRALVLYSKTGFFYDGPQARGVSYEALKELEKFLNKKLDTGKQPVHMVFIPVSREEGVKRMADGRGDIAVANIPIIPEIQKIVDLSDPVRSSAKEIVVTGPSASPVKELDDLSGKEVYARKLSRYWPNLLKLNEEFGKSGKPLMKLKEADPNLADEELLSLVNGGVVGITVMDDLVAGLWGKVYDKLDVHEDVVLYDGDRIAWGVQKGASRFLGLVNEFVKDHKEGTSFGNTMIQRYFKNEKWAADNTRPSEMERFRKAVTFFKKYGKEYEFNWLMIAAQAFQESGIDQSRRSPAGAVGVMQIKPSTAADPSVNIKNVEGDIESNIHAGVKYLDFIMDRYFKDAEMNEINRGLFAFASYNAGPARIAKLRKTAESEGLDPNLWFNNVELIAAREIGAETVTYVSNIYKYFIAYEIVAEDMGPKRKS